MEAGTFNCPTCGAAISKDSTQCQYCGSALQTIACSSCFGMMFLGSKFCPHCGAKVAVVEQGPTVAHQCPRCNIELTKVAVGASQLEECSHCGGLWVLSEMFQQICSDNEAQTVAITLKLPPPVPAEAHVRYLKCPRCATLMGRMNYHHSSVIVDVCRPHGIWFDRDGLRKIIEFIRAGGLEHERQAEIEQLARTRSAIDSRRDVHVPYSDNSLFSNSTSNNALDVLSGIASLVSWWIK